MNAELVGEIVRALGGGQEEVEHWLQRCGRARAAVVLPPSTRPSAPDPVPVPAAVTGAEPKPAGRDIRSVVTVLALSLALNLVGYAVVVQLRLPLYLDMVGTAVASFALGPWAGAAVGLTTNAAGTALDGPTALPFGLVNAVGGIVWGYGIRRVSDIPGFLKLNLITALCCSLTAIPILLGMFHGRTGHLVDHVASKLSVFGDAPGVVASNLLVSAMDRPLSGFLALAVVCSLSRRHAVPHLGTLLNPGDSRLSVGPAPGGPPAR